MGVGTKLKEAREAKGMSLDSLQETTKIQKRYLRAIEEESFDVLPGKFYARAFIKEYASAVNLDIDELFEEYQDDLPQPEEQKDVQYTRVQRTRRESNLSKNSRLFSLVPTIIVVLLIIGVIFAIWYFMNGSTATNEQVDQAEEQDDNAIIRSPNSNDEEDGIVQDEEERVDEEEKNDETSSTDEDHQESELSLSEDDSGDNPGTTFNLSNVGDELNLILESSGETWLEVEDTQGEQLFYGILAADESPFELDISDETELYFSVGNASVLDIKFNDLDLEYPSESVVQKFWVNIEDN